ncbi:MAG: DUF3240 family protein [Campylobacterales bacterium]|nr:DUF3240 family protein [Campylobacterales bacterium]
MKLKQLNIYFEMGIKDTLVDLLLAQEHDDFYFFHCNRYGAGAFLISVEEQVSARRAFGLFQLFLTEDEILSLSTQIKEKLKDKTIRLFTSDVTEL